MKTIFYFCLMVLGLGGLAGAEKIVGGDKPAVQEKKDGVPSLDYVLHSGDVLSVQIFQEKDLDCVLRISQDRTIKLSLIGNIDVKGKTVSQVENLVRELYDRDYLVNPQVHINVTEYAPRTVDVLGQVNKSGPVPFPQEKGLTLIQAISAAGGFNRLARDREVTLTRTTPDGKKESTVIDAHDLMSNNKNGTNQWPLQPDDIIFVPEIRM